MEEDEWKFSKRRSKGSQCKANRQWEWRFGLHPALPCLFPALPFAGLVCTLKHWNSPVWLAVPYAIRISPLKLAVSALNARIASSRSDLLTETKLATGSGELVTAWHPFHVKKYPLPEIIMKEPHLGKYFLKQPQMGKFAIEIQIFLQFCVTLRL